MAQEIEIKFSLPSKDLEKLQKWLDKNSEFKGEVKHVEYYLNNPEKSFKFKDKEGYIDALDYFRVRFAEKGDSVCLKKFHEDPERPGFTTHCDEYEFDVSNGEIALKLLEQLGFTDNFKMEKTRKIYQTKDFEIVVDDVKDLDVFVEIELNEEYEDPKEGKEKILSFLRELGISKIREHRRGYLSMLMNDYDFGEDVKL